jgi:hypothetical protein
LGCFLAFFSQTHLVTLLPIELETDTAVFRTQSYDFDLQRQDSLSRFENKYFILLLKNALAYYNDGVVAVNKFCSNE